MDQVKKQLKTTQNLLEKLLKRTERMYSDLPTFIKYALLAAVLIALVTSVVGTTLLATFGLSNPFASAETQAAVASASGSTTDVSAVAAADEERMSQGNDMYSAQVEQPAGVDVMDQYGSCNCAQKQML